MGPIYSICSVFCKPKTVLKIKVLIFKTKTKGPDRLEREQSRTCRNKKINIKISLHLGKENWMIDLKKLFSCSPEKKGDGWKQLKCPSVEDSLKKLSYKQALHMHTCIPIYVHINTHIGIQMNH